MKLQEKYKTYQKKYNLPSFEDTDKFFDIEDINAETTKLPMKIVEKIHDKIEHYIKLVENIIQPDTDIGSLYEAKYVSDNDKTNAYTLYKKLMILLREAQVLILNQNEELASQYINHTSTLWKTYKNDIETHLKQLQHIWEKETDINNDISYFG